MGASHSHRRVDGAAIFSPDGRHRYQLTRHWAQGPRVCFVMLNPSTADAESDDPTIRRCIAFARAWEYGGVVIVNLFGLRAIHPSDLLKVSFAERIGPENDSWILRAHATSERTVAAWGEHRAIGERDRDVIRLLDAPLYCIALTNRGRPRHPLYLKGSSRVANWPRRIDRPLPLRKVS